MTNSSNQSILQEAMTEVSSIMADALQELGAPSPTQDDLRPMFDEAMETPEAAEAMRLQLGDDEYIRQMALARKRRQKDGNVRAT